MKIVNNRQFRVKLVFSRTLYSQSAGSVTMGSLAAYLRSVGFDADLCLLNDRQLHNTEIVLGGESGLNVVIAKPNFKDYQTMLPMLERLKSAQLVSRVFLCGPFAKLNADSLMSNLRWLDGILKGQPEASARDLLASLSDDCSSWDFRSPGTLSRSPLTSELEVYTSPTSVIPLSDLPFPARDIELVEAVSYVNVEGSRGCMFDCSFCHIPLDAGLAAVPSPSAVRDPVLVVDEMEHLNKKMRKTLFIFNDSCFWSTKKDDARILRFCQEITDRKLDVRIYIYLKGEPFIGAEILEALAKAGLVRVFLGVENAVPSSLALYQKKVRPDLYTTVKGQFDRLGINIHIGYITVEPHSSLDDVRSNIEYLHRIGKLFRLGVVMEPVRVIPGSSLHTRLVADGLMRSDLPYDKITYGYRFAHPEVGTLLGDWKSLFEGILKEAAYGFEYYSTVGELLRVLVQKLDPNFESVLSVSYEAFNSKKREGVDMLRDYFMSTIEIARQRGASATADRFRSGDFIARFTQIAGELSVLYAGIVALVKQNGGERAVREVYVG